MVASRLPSRSPVQAAHQLEIAPRGGIDLHRAVGALAARRRERRQLAGLGELDIVEQRAAGRDLGAREGAEAVERRDVEGACRRLRALSLSKRAEGSGVSTAFHSSSTVFNGSRASSRSGTSSSPGASRARAAASWPASKRLGGEVGGREVEPGQRQLALRLGDGGEIVVAARIEQRILGQGAGRDDAHHGALDHRLGAALLGLGRILDLLADRDLEALADQPRQIGLVAVHRHAAHLDVFAQMLAALGQRDVERRRGLDRVVEEQLVEIAHAVEQQMVGMHRLDRQVLAHHRRGIGGKRRKGVAVGHGWLSVGSRSSMIGLPSAGGQLGETTWVGWAASIARWAGWSRPAAGWCCRWR